MRKFTADSDEDLFLLIRQGNDQAFSDLYQKYWDKAFADAYKRLRNIDQAKDIVQDIFVNIWSRRETLAIENFPAYLAVAVRNQVLRAIGKQQLTHPFFDFMENIPAIYHNADSNLLFKEFTASYDNFVEALPPKRQLIFRLRFQEDKSTKDIAKSLSLSINTVQNQLGKAIEQLKTSISHLLMLLLLIVADMTR